MEKNQVKKIYQKKIKELINHNENYYDKNSPKISDSEYDSLKKKL